MTHERAVLDDLMRHIESLATAEGAERVIAVTVRLGPLSHFTPGHFREHFEWAAAGGVAEGAEVSARVDEDLTGTAAQGVVLEDLRVRLPAS